jgi:hypothetical protein
MPDREFHSRSKIIMMPPPSEIIHPCRIGPGKRRSCLRSVPGYWAERVHVPLPGTDQTLRLPELTELAQRLATG